METYVLVPCPECQEFMEEQWFYDEAILAVDDEAILAVGAKLNLGSSAYFLLKNFINCFSEEKTFILC